MTHPSRFPLLLLAGLLCAALLALPAQAEKADRNKPMNIEADSLRYDDLQQTSVFTGNVVLTKGTLLMRGARIEVRQDAEGYQYATVVSVPPKQAYYKQKREGVDETIEAEADTIYYDGKADVVKFTQHAVLRRYKGAQLNDETQGSVITYDNTTDIFTVEGRASLPNPGTASAARPAQGANTGGRIRAMLTPRAAASAAASPGAAGTPVPLQLSPQLGPAPGLAPSPAPGQAGTPK